MSKTSTLASWAFWKNKLAVRSQNTALDAKKSVFACQEFWYSHCWEAASISRKRRHVGDNKVYFK